MSYIYLRNLKVTYMQREIKHTFYFTQTPEEVWDYLTKPELMEQWLMPSDFKPSVGHHFRFTNPNNTFVVCEVVEVNPFTRLSYIWKNDWAVTKTPYTSTVTWTLTRIDGGTELLLVHRGFEVFKNLFDHNRGWMHLCNKLAEILKTAVK
ncbi:MAG TPA: SRPBCC domain-containing protein [Cyclobacteriaceae bacterium]|nr:SRPBCC domain-containing protein [Cyclobacteriaceae bacterium]